MIIKSIRASFGGLHDAELELNPDLNVIEAPNEAGKSTLCAFIRTMLYGIDTSKRAKGEFSADMPDKERFLPWGGYSMQGEMSIIWRGQDVTLTRAGAAGRPMGDCRAVREGTGIRVPELCGKAPGEVILGVPESVFRRSAFISGADMAVSRDAELDRRIESLVSSGSETDGVYSEADALLHRWQVNRRHNARVGRIPELERRLAEKRAALADIEAENARLGDKFGEKERLAARVAALERELRLNDQSRAQSARIERAAAQQRLEALEARADGLSQEKIDAARRAMNEYEVARRAGAPAPERGRAKLAAAAVLLVLGALLCGAFFAVRNIALPVAGAALLIAGIIVLLSGRGGQPEGEAAHIAARRLEKALAAIGVEAGAEDAEAAIEEKSRLFGQLELARSEYSSALRLEKALAADSDSAPEPGAPTMPAQSARAGLASAREALSSCERELNLSAGRLEHLGDPVVLAAEAGELEKEISRLEDEYRAIGLAREALKNANREIQVRLAPMISRLAGEYMARMTGGRHSRLEFDDEFRFSASGHGVGFLSSGTAAQLYLAVRLAMCGLVMAEGESCPIILDDALTGFDDTRARAALRLLRELSAERQVIIFTCQSRERRLLAELAAE